MTGTRSGTPLVRTLDLRDGQRVWFDAMPEAVIDEIDEYALELVFVPDPAEGLDAAHVFVTDWPTSPPSWRLCASRSQPMDRFG